jgi:serine/threonine-protein kinase
MEKTQIDPARVLPPQPPNPATVPADPLQDIRSLGPYRILRRLGEGGMGAVYLGYREGDAQQVAIKVLNNGLAESQPIVARFLREARNGIELDHHPNLVRTLDVDKDRATGRQYLVLEFVDGPSAHVLLSRYGKFSVGDAVYLALDVARGLEHAHSRNIIHRDIKPDNILITRSGVAKLVDLGLAKRTDDATNITIIKQGFGSTPYMPWEQAMDAKSADARADIYALGATIYHLVTGQEPFPGASPVQIFDKKRLGEFTPAGAINPEVPLALDLILARMMACEPDNRYQTISEVIVDLERSQLAATVPSYADADQAQHDPEVQANHVAAEPTRLDPNAPPVEEDLWHLRYRTATGKVMAAKASTPQVVQRLRAGRLPKTAEARRSRHDPFVSVESIPEFLDAVEEAEAAAAEAPFSWVRVMFAVLLVFGAFFTAAGLLALIIWLRR